MSERACDDSRIHQMIAGRQLYHDYQPIYRLKNWEIVGYEVLLRSPLIRETEEIFRIAEATQQLYEIDTQSIMYALSFYRTYMISSHHLLFLNLFPSTITHPSFLSFLGQNPQPYHNIILEINEGEIIPDLNRLKKCTDRLKEMGFLIAIDDFGKGETSIETALFLEPAFIKMDRVWTAGISVSKEKEERVGSLNDFFLSRGIRVILEGIEEPADLAMAKALGIEMGQGFLLGPPAPFRKTSSM